LKEIKKEKKGGSDLARSIGNDRSGQALAGWLRSRKVLACCLGSIGRLGRPAGPWPVHLVNGLATGPFNARHTKIDMINLIVHATLSSMRSNKGGVLAAVQDNVLCTLGFNENLARAYKRD
jgi:hypothetical protein